MQPAKPGHFHSTDSLNRSPGTGYRRLAELLILLKKEPEELFHER
ncbi:hypothetical protein TorRG33x02_124930 [Trema orientale]|uniref:Uncharacterized protein n=1 Tax=Trema orientale TaxID=63057 RepID=A0A2P5F1J5_TREOI|nr:hypothetical protein TorRG33x02_124930 [Trema orientale]